ncbi:MAG: protein translocase subunit SecDF [Rikenellaceae bacterium]|nr:protein translocase subunit SecDF [Rikenellaceae bacterium]
MQNKGVIKLLAVLLAIACVYQLSFSFATRRVEKKAAEYAATYPVELQDKMEQQYLDSIQNLPVYSLGIVDYTYKECQEKEINLGLDLKGGMNVMLEVQQGDVLKSLSDDSQDPKFLEALSLTSEQTRDGGDYIAIFAKNYAQVSGGQPLALIFNTPSMKEINANSTDEEVLKVLRAESDDAIAASYDILRSRIDRFGVTSPNIQRLPNSNRILVELPGVKEPERVRKLLQGSASLEFWETYSTNELMGALEQADALLRNIKSSEAAPVEEATEEVAEEAAPAEDNALVAEVAEQTSEAAVATEAMSFEEQEKINPLFVRLFPGAVYADANNPIIGYATSTDTTIVNKYLAMPQIKALFPRDVRFMWSVKPYENKRAAAEGVADPFDGKFELFAVKVNTFDGKAPLDGSVVVDATADYARQGADAEVSMTMNSEGMQKWAQLTGQNIGRAIAIALDGYIYSAPNVLSAIDGGQSRITGNFTINEAKDLANVLKSGKVRAPSRIIQDTVVGPSLGQESINAGMFSFIIAFVLVLIYMGVFYSTGGWISCIALVTNLFLLMGVLVSFGAVLTLPGIAGIVLTMGMAVDANVIIYERIKEELRAGKGLAMAIKDGYSNAYSAIVDGQLTTMITGIVLFIFGNGPVQGFATTLIIGIITSVFTSIYITRLIIDARVNKGKNIKFSFKWSENMLANTNFDFIGKRKIAYIVSGTMLLLSVASFAIRGFNMGVEFTGGRAYVVRFDQNVSADDVRSALENAFPGDASNVSLEVKQYGDENQMRIVTQYKFDDTSEEATAEVDQLLYNNLKGLYSYDITLEGFTSTQNDQNGIISADKIGPSIARDMTRSAIMAVIFSLIAIALYIILRFKKWQWGLGAVVSLTHNALLVMGIFSLLYGLMPFALEVNQSFIAAILTIIGYSINDTVVIFDRIREYQVLYPKREIGENINKAINSTLSRTLNTSGTTFVTLLAIFLFGGETIRGFVFALIFGIIIGTYSSVFVATPVAYEMMTKKANKKN